MTTSTFDTSFEPRVIKWSATELLKDVVPSDVTANQTVRKDVYHDLWGDMCAEYDADNLWRHLNQLGLDFSSEFKSALAEWRTDERNHYVGLRLICSFMYDVPESEIDTQMRARCPNFTDISRFLTDEFRICVVLAYDELVSALGYKMFFEDFEKFGPSTFLQFVKRAARDEMLHYKNFLDVISLVHTSDVERVSEVIKEIGAYELKPDMVYNATFLLDHTEETFRRDFLVDCGQSVIEEFRSICGKSGVNATA